MPNVQSQADIDLAIKAFQLKRNLDARETHLKLAAVIQDLQTSGLARSFFDLIDESAGEHACHPWRGKINESWNKERSEYGFGEFDEMQKILGTSLAHRVVVMLWFGVPIPKDHDIYPACGEHTCCNITHLKIRPHAGKLSRKIGVTVTSFFCREAKAA
jgi:hypothetical protein